MGDLRKIGKYILLEEQEISGVGRTWRGAELANGMIDKYLLVEFVQEKLAADDGFIDQYLSQSLVAAKLEHPNILRKVNSIHESGQLVTAFEFHEGFSLQKVLNRCQNDGFPLHIDHALLVASKLLAALTYVKSKHITHGFIHPTMVFVTHEGEIKLKGFALSAGLRHFRSGELPLGPEFSKYLPPGLSLTNEDRDHLDIYGCGAILFEMIAGEGFQSGATTDPGSRIDHAVAASSSEPIPPKIAAILHKALNPGAGQSYIDIQQMGKEMEELLYSGEYSPTTFNLAFFMHSAFRAEMEDFSDRIAKEREIDFSGHSVSQLEAASSGGSTTQAAEAPPIPVAAVSTTDPTTPGIQQPVPPRKSKSKIPLLVGGLLGLAVIIVLVVVLLPKDNKSQDRFQKRAAELQAEGAKSEKALLEQQQEELRLQNQALMAQLKQQTQEAQDARKTQLEEQMREADEELAKVKIEKAQLEAQKEIDAERARLKEERKAFQALQEEQQKAAEVALVKKEAPPDEPEKEADASTDDPSGADSGTKNQPSQDVSSPPDEAESRSARPVDVPKERTDDGGVLESSDVSINKPEKRKVPPVEGQLIALDDPDLRLPTLLVPYKTHQVPTKAIKAGVVRRDRTIPFIMRVLVDEKGNVEDTEMYRSPLKEGDNDYGMIDKAFRTAKKMRFSNPTKMGVDVKVWMYVTVNFTSK